MPGLSELLTGVKMPEIDPLTLAQLKTLQPGLRDPLAVQGGYGDYAQQQVSNLIAPYQQAAMPTAAQDPGAALDMLSSLAQSNPNPAAATALSGALGTLGFNPDTLSSMVSSLYSDPNAPSALYQTDPSKATISEDDFQGINQTISQVLQQGGTLHDARMLVMSQARSKASLPTDQLEALYNYIGAQWVQLGGDPGDAPLTATQQPTPSTTPGY